MRLRGYLFAVLVLGALAPPAAAETVEEHATGGAFDQSWSPAFGLPPNLVPVAGAPSDAEYDNPSGDHTVVCLTNSEPQMGGLGKAAMDPLGNDGDYRWEGWMFTGDGSTRRGLVVRSNQHAQFTSCYQLVLEQGLLTINLRKLGGESGAALASWLTTDFGGFPGQNVWVHLAIEVQGNALTCYYNGRQLNATPIVDAVDPLLSGWPGVYNFRFDLGGVSVYFDDLILTPEEPVAVEPTTWSRLKAGAGR